MRGNRVVIPIKLRKTVLQSIHESHPGIVKMKVMAREYVWWPDLEKDIEYTVKTCMMCAQEARQPDKPRLRVHSDFLGPFYGRMFMVVLDAHSKWPEIIDMGQNTTTERVIEAFDEFFIRYGYPKLLVTDCGRQYTSSKFIEFCKKRGISQSFSPPYHPATNGAAENFVQTFKKRVKKIVKSGKTLKEAINLFLSDYRNTCHSTTNRSPAFLLYRRELRTRFDLFRPDIEKTVMQKQQQQISYRKGRRRAVFNVGDHVMVDDHTVRSEKRILAVMKKQLSPVTFLVEVAPNITWKRHVDK